MRENTRKIRDGEDTLPHCVTSAAGEVVGSEPRFWVTILLLSLPRAREDIETCVAVDSGPAVVSRKAARSCGRNAAERNAIVIDRFFDTKREAIAWTGAHPHFMTVRILNPGA